MTSTHEPLEAMMQFEWGREAAERLGEMHTITSEQYRCACVVAFPNDSAEDVISHCRRVGAIYHEDGPDDECFCVVLRFDVGPELYSEAALRRSLP